MKLRIRHFNRRQKSITGFTLVEMMISVALGLILLVGVAILYINGNESFVAMANYQNLDKYSVSALDILSREIRNATAVTDDHPSQSITLNNATSGETIVISSNANTLFLTKNGTSQILLTGLDSWSFSLYSKAPTVTNMTFNLVTTPSACKLIQMNWKCSRTILGSKLNTESVQTAQIVLRNKTQ